MEHTLTSIRPLGHKWLRSCLWCAESFWSKRQSKNTCSNACRQARYRAEKRKRETGSYN